MNYKGLATKIFGGFVDRYLGKFSFLKDVLPKAGIMVSLRTYLSIIFLSTVFVYISSLIGVVVVLSFFEFSLFLRIAYILFVPFLISAAAFIIFTLYPMQRMLGRAKGIEVNLPFVLTHMGAIAQSGVPPYIVFKLISQFEEYGEVANEMKKIVRNIEVFGMDPVSAVKEVAKRTPSESLKQVLLGFVSTTESGGDIRLYLRNAGEQALFEWKLKREKFLQQLSAYAEFYTGILIAAPLFLIALFAIMNMIQPRLAGFDIFFLTRLSVYLIIPAINLGFLLFLRGVEVEM
jgi:flagellar protein FlaJ